MADGHHDPLRRLQASGADKFDMRPQFVKSHCRRFDGAGEVFPDAPEIFPGQRADFLRRFFLAETHRQIFQRHAPVPRVEPEGQPAARPAEACDKSERQRLNQRHERTDGPVNQCVHF